MGFVPWEIRVAFLGESQLRQSRATEPTVHAGCFGVSIINPNSDMDYKIMNVRTDVLMLTYTIAHGNVRTLVRESALQIPFSFFYFLIFFLYILILILFILFVCVCVCVFYMHV